MAIETVEKAPSYWVLAKLGKKVLRPGGEILTKKLVELLRIGKDDHVVELAPGRGHTATLVLDHHPNSYTGIELDLKYVAKLQHRINGPGVHFLQGSATETGLTANSADKMFGEAFLSMQSDAQKKSIIKEAFRVLKPGGLFAIHELSLQPDAISEEKKKEIQKALSEVVKVNARPLTKQEWFNLLSSEGFKVVNLAENAMHLLQPSRMITDEGFFNALKIGWNLLISRSSRRRIFAMRNVFKKYEENLSALVLIAEKKQ